MKFDNNFFWSVITLIVSVFVLSQYYIPSETLSITDFHGDDQQLIGFLKNAFDTKNYIDILAPGNQKFRPISMLLYGLELKFFGESWILYIYFNLFLVLLFGMLLVKFSSYFVEPWIGCLFAFVAITSKFLAYSIWNITGSFEVLSLIFCFIYFLALQKNTNVLMLVVLGSILLLTNERYLPVLLISTLSCRLKHQDGIKKFTVIIALLLLYLFIRLFFSIPMLVGTQTDNILLSFDVNRFILHISKSILEVFGFSAGPMYLSGMEHPIWLEFKHWSADSKRILAWQIINSLGMISLAVACKTYRVFLLSIIATVVITASVTFRVELRWLTLAYILSLLAMLSSFNSIYLDKFKSKILFGSCVALLLSISIQNIYFLDKLLPNFYFSDKISKKL